MKLIDIHSHILPGLDDGPQDEAAALEMARLYQELGFEKVIAATHIMEKSGFKNTKLAIEEKTKNLNQQLRSAGLELEILAGAEYYLEQSFAELAEKQWPLARLNNSNYILIELPVLFLPAFIGLSFFDTRINNPELKKLLPFLRLILAHPERNEEVIKKPGSGVRRMKEQGIFIQMNLGSLIGFYGKTVKKAAETLLKEKLVDLVGTDAHSPDQLRNIVPEGIKRLEKLAGGKSLEVLFRINPSRVVAGEPLEPFY